jgi:hypothetical protein
VLGEALVNAVMDHCNHRKNQIKRAKARTHDGSNRKNPIASANRKD